MRLTKALRDDWVGSLYKGLSVTVGAIVASAFCLIALKILLGIAFIGLALGYLWLLHDDPSSVGKWHELLSGGISRSLVPLWAVLWSLAVLGGGISWFRLSVCFWYGGTRKLRQMDWRWWVLLSIGMLAMAPLLYAVIQAPSSDRLPLIKYVVICLPLLSIYLCCLRLRRDAVTPPAMPPAAPRTLKQLIDETD